MQEGGGSREQGKKERGRRREQGCVLRAMLIALEIKVPGSC